MAKQRGEAYEEISAKLREWCSGETAKIFTQRDFCEATGVENNTTTMRNLRKICDVVVTNVPFSTPAKYRYPKREMSAARSEANAQYSR